MIGIYLVTGFLGAGKTTLLRNLARLLAPQRLRLIINEFGKVGVDGALLADMRAALDEINNGSIFCSCRFDRFEEALGDALKDNPDAVIVEASGLSDPSAVERILGAQRYSGFDYKGAICVVDAKNFHKVFATARVCRRQPAVSGLIVINKADLVSAAELESVKDTLRGAAPAAEIRVTSFGVMEPSWLDALRRTGAPDAQTEGRDLTLQKYALKIRDGMSRGELAHLIAIFAEDTYRVKGFVLLAEGLHLADCVGPLVDISPWEGEAPADVNTLVVLAGKGMNPRRSIRTAMEWYPERIEKFE